MNARLTDTARGVLRVELVTMGTEARVDAVDSRALRRALARTSWTLISRWNDKTNRFNQM